MPCLPRQDNPATVTRDGQAADRPVREPTQDLELPAVCEIPDADGAIPASSARYDLAAIGCDRDAVDVVAAVVVVPVEPMELSPGVDLPQPDDAFVASGGYDTTVRQGSHASHRPMALESPQLAAGLQVPQPHGAVNTGGNARPPSGRKVTAVTAPV